MTVPLGPTPLPSFLRSLGLLSTWHYGSLAAILLYMLSSFLYSSKALKQLAVDEGFYFFASNPNLPNEYLRSSRSWLFSNNLNFISWWQHLTIFRSVRCIFFYRIQLTQYSARTNCGHTRIRQSPSGPVLLSA